VQSGHSDSIARQFETPSINSLHPAEARIVIALRKAVCARSSGKDMAMAISSVLSAPNASQGLLLLIENMGTVWPTAFSTRIPCCRSTTPDEWCFVQMLRRAAMDDRPAFDTLLSEMIDWDGRDRLFCGLQAFFDSFRPADATNTHGSTP